MSTRKTPTGPSSTWPQVRPLQEVLEGRTPDRIIELSGSTTLAQAKRLALLHFGRETGHPGFRMLTDEETDALFDGLEPPAPPVRRNDLPLWGFVLMVLGAVLIGGWIVASLGVGGLP